jgi:hypothetical protein
MQVGKATTIEQAQPHQMPVNTDNNQVPKTAQHAQSITRQTGNGNNKKALKSVRLKGFLWLRR